MEQKFLLVETMQTVSPYDEMFHEIQNRIRNEKCKPMQNIMNFIINYGGVRKEVFEWLSSHFIISDQMSKNILSLIQDQADVKWFDLLWDAYENKTNAQYYFMAEILQAYRSGLSFEKTHECYIKCRTASEMAFMRHEIKKNMLSNNDYQAQENEKMHQVLENVSIAAGELAESTEAYRANTEKLEELLQQQKESIKNKDERIQELEETKKEPDIDKKDARIEELLKQVDYYRNQCQKLQDQNLLITKTLIDKKQTEKKEQPEPDMQKKLNEKNSVIEKLNQKIVDCQKNIQEISMENVKLKEQISKEKEKEDTEKDEDSPPGNQERPPDITDKKSNVVYVPESMFMDENMEVDVKRKQKKQAKKRISFLTRFFEKKEQKNFEKLTKQEKKQKIIETVIKKQFDNERIMLIRKLLDNNDVGLSFLKTLVDKNASEQTFCSLINLVEKETISPKNSEKTESASDNKANQKNKETELSKKQQEHQETSEKQPEPKKAKERTDASNKIFEETHKRMMGGGSVKSKNPMQKSEASYFRDRRPEQRTSTVSRFTSLPMQSSTDDDDDEEDDDI